MFKDVNIGNFSKNGKERFHSPNQGINVRSKRKLKWLPLKCGDPKNGFIQQRYFNCGEIKIIPFSCKSRLCPSCSRIHLQERIIKIKSIMIKGVGHRHVVLTIPKELWSYFRRDGYLLKIMTDAGAELIKDILKFYRPHLHLLITEGGLSKDNK